VAAGQNNPFLKEERFSPGLPKRGKPGLKFANAFSVIDFQSLF
jgi:hypothetical protein